MFGEKTAQRIVEAFGKDALEVIYESPEKLAQVQGISKNKANEISQEYREKREFFNILEYLKKYNLSIENVTQVYNEYGVNTVDIIKNNPYVILDIWKI